MTGSIADAAVIVAVVTNGLLAGLFFAFAVAVCPALGRLDAPGYVRAFRAINAAILNPWFLGVFLAAPAAAVVAFALAPGRPWLLAGALGSLATLVITSAANVPLNRRLDAAPTAEEAAWRAARAGFEPAWNRWNLLRTLTSVGALACLAVAAGLPG